MYSRQNEFMYGLCYLIMFVCCLHRLICDVAQADISRAVQETFQTLDTVILQKRQHWLEWNQATSLAQGGVFTPSNFKDMKIK